MIRTRVITLTVPSQEEIREMRACTTIVRESRRLDVEKYKEPLSWMNGIDEGRYIDLSKLSITVDGEVASSEAVDYPDAMFYVGDFTGKHLGPTLVLAEMACEGHAWFDGLVDNTDELDASDHLLVAVHRVYGQRCVATLVVPSGADAIKKAPLHISEVRSVLQGVCF